MGEITLDERMAMAVVARHEEWTKKIFQSHAKKAGR